MQARKQNSNNAKDKLKLFEILQTQRKANEKKAQKVHFQNQWHTLKTERERRNKSIQRYYRRHDSSNYKK